MQLYRQLLNLTNLKQKNVSVHFVKVETKEQRC